MRFQSIALLSWLSVVQAGTVYNTFDGNGFPACHNISEIRHPFSMAELQSNVKEAVANGWQVRATGKGHMWYDTMCSDDGTTMIIQTEEVNQITGFDLPQGAKSGSVWIEAGVTFFQFADFLHARGASMGYTLVNWNMTIAGAVAMGAHRSSLREASMVAAGVQEIHIIDGTGNIRMIPRDQNNDDWLAASTSLGLLGIIVKMKFTIYPDFKVYAQQKTLEEDAVLNGDIYGMIAPYATANFWWWPFLRKFHHRYYDVVPNDSNHTQQGFQSTFSITPLEGPAALALLNSGKFLPTSNWIAERTFFDLWSKPNFHDKVTDKQIDNWPIYGWNYDVLIGGLYPGMKPEWDYDLHGLTLELAVPVTMANKLLKRVRQLFDDEAKKLIWMTSTYRSGINIKFGRPYDDLLGQVATSKNTNRGRPDEADVDWSKGAIMFDFPSFKPMVGDGLRYNEPFYHNLAQVIVNEFPCRPHWTKNTREVLGMAKKNLDPGHLARFKTVRQKFDPKGVYRSVVGEILGMY